MALDYFSQGGSSSTSVSLEWGYQNDLAFGVKIRIQGTGIDYTSSVILSGQYDSGAPYATGLSPSTTYSYTLTVLRNSNNATIGTRTISATTLSPPPVFSGSFGSGSRGVYYSQSISVSGATLVDYEGDPPSLPPGLSMSFSSSGATLSGTPTETGSYGISLFAYGGGSYAYQSYTVTINPPPPYWVTTYVDTFARVGAAYSSFVYAPNSTNYSIVSGSLPEGLSGAGDISGTPTTRGTYNFTIRASNDYGYVDAAQSIRVYARLPQWTDSSLADTMRVGSAYSDSITAQYASSYVTSGSIPGITFPSGSSGTVSGTPTSAGTYSITTYAYNADSEGIETTHSFTVKNRMPVWTDQTIILTGKVGEAYSDNVVATYAASYGVDSGTLPTGLTLNTSTGALTGTPTTAGTYTFTLKASNANSESITTSSFSLVIAASGGKVKVFNGSTWVDSRTVYVWNGTSWVESPLYVNTAGGWIKSVSN